LPAKGRKSALLYAIMNVYVDRLTGNGLEAMRLAAQLPIQADSF
jgi:hypothetical protein